MGRQTGRRTDGKRSVKQQLQQLVVENGDGVMVTVKDGRIVERVFWGNLTNAFDLTAYGT